MQSREKVLMAVDLSLSNTGVALFTYDGKPVKILSVSTNPQEDRSQRLRQIGQAIIDIESNYNLSEIVIEQGFYRYATSTQSLYQVQGVLLYLLYEYPHYFYAPSTIKKIVTGKGNSSKSKVQEIISKIFPDLEFSNTDQSDAVAVGLAHLIKTGVVRSHL